MMLDRMQEAQTSINRRLADPLEVLWMALSLQIFRKMDLEVLMRDDLLDEFCLRKFADSQSGRLA